MIIVYLSLWQKIKLLFGWYVQIELWPLGAQSYCQNVLPPWQPQRKWWMYEHRHRNASQPPAQKEQP